MANRRRYIELFVRSLCERFIVTEHNTGKDLNYCEYEVMTRFAQWLIEEMDPPDGREPLTLKALMHGEGAEWKDVWKPFGKD